MKAFNAFALLALSTLAVPQTVPPNAPACVSLCFTTKVRRLYFGLWTQLTRCTPGL